MRASPPSRRSASRFSRDAELMALDEIDEELRVLREMASAYAEARIAPIAAEVDRSDRFPRELWPEMGRLGLHGVTVEEEFGGAGLGYLAHAIVSEEISRRSGSVGISYIAHSNLCVNQIRLNGTAEQKRRFLPGLLDGTKVGALAMSETGAGSDVVSLRLAATRRGDRFVLEGTKIRTTNGAVADVYVIYAKTDPAAGKKGISAFLVERGAPGFTQAPPLDKLGMRGSGTCELVFSNCEIPAENVLGAVGDGVRVLMKGLDFERIVAASAPIGMMQAALDIGLAYARRRKQFGR